MGLAAVASTPYPDPTQFDEQSEYFDPKAHQENPRWILVDVQIKQKFNRKISLAQLKAESALGDMLLLRRGNRLSITPVSENEFKSILSMAEAVL